MKTTWRVLPSTVTISLFVIFAVLISDLDTFDIYNDNA
jgi:hypothetical protein